MTEKKYILHLLHYIFTLRAIYCYPSVIMLTVCMIYFLSPRSNLNKKEQRMLLENLCISVSGLHKTHSQAKDRTEMELGKIDLCCVDRIHEAEDKTVVGSREHGCEPSGFYSGSVFFELLSP